MKHRASVSSLVIAASVAAPGIRARRGPLPDRRPREARGRAPAIHRVQVEDDSDRRVDARDGAAATSTAVDDAERLKRGLHQLVRDQEVRWVLLVGDADVMPVRYMVLDRVTPAAFDYAFYPSDLYYADLAEGRRLASRTGTARRTGFHAATSARSAARRTRRTRSTSTASTTGPRSPSGAGRVSDADAAPPRRPRSRSATTRPPSAREPWLRRAAPVAVGGWVDARGAMDRRHGRARPGLDASRSGTTPTRARSRRRRSRPRPRSCASQRRRRARVPRRPRLRRLLGAVLLRRVVREARERAAGCRS